MSTKIISRSSLGLRQQGTGGQTATDSYRTIDHHLRRTLSEAHADLLAEPNVLGAGGLVDWYTPVEAAEGAVAIGALPEARRTRVCLRLAELVGDIRTHAATLKSSARQGDRLLGQLLLMAVEVPGEDCVFAVGDQPVLVFWGHLQDVPLPDRGVIDGLIARYLPPEPAAAAPPLAIGPAEDTGQPQPVAVPAAPVPARLPPVQPAQQAPNRAEGTGASWLSALLWASFALLCLVIVASLLKSCGVGLPLAPGHDDANAGQLADLQTQNARLQDELDRLLGSVADRRRQCSPTPAPAPAPAAPPSAPAMAPPAAPPASGIELPKDLDKCKGADCLAFLEGCWSSPTNLVPVLPDGKKDLSRRDPAIETWCFGKDGKGSFSLKTEGGTVCTTSIEASLGGPGGQLTAEHPAMRCSNQRNLPGTSFSCTRDAKGQTHCVSDDDRDNEVDLRKVERQGGS